MERQAMNRIIFPLKLRMRGQKVADLQNALKELLERGVILENYPIARWILSTTLQGELRRQYFGLITTALVATFQRERQFKLAGSVDEATAYEINVILREWRLPDIPHEDGSLLVRGRVVSHELRCLPDLHVVAVDKNVGGDVLLGEATTGERGAYEIRYSVKQLRKGKEKPDIQVQVLDQYRELFASSAVRYNAGLEENELDIVIPAERLPRPAEYRRLISELGAQLGTMDDPQLKKRLAALKEDDERQDITYLANKTGWDAGIVAMAALASQFSEKSGIEPEFYYALLRSGVPANEVVFSLMSPGLVEQVWESAVDKYVLPAQLRERIPDSIEIFKGRGVQTLLTEQAQIGISGFKEVLKGALLDADNQDRLTQLFYEKRANLDDFWEHARREFPDAVDRLQLYGKLAILTINNAPLIQQVYEKYGDLRTPLDLVRRGLYRKEAWEQLLDEDTAIPDEIPGETPEEKQTNYSEYLASQLRFSYPTAVISEMVKANDIQLHTEPWVKTAVTQFLDDHQGIFELGIHPVEYFLRKNKIELEVPVLAQVKKLQGVYQISPTDEAIVILLEHNLDSAYAVVKFSEQNFIKAFKDEFRCETMARLIYHKAHQMHYAVLNITTAYPCWSFDQARLSSSSFSIFKDCQSSSS
jgi:hypothetical protein